MTFKMAWVAFSSPHDLAVLSLPWTSTSSHQPLPTHRCMMWPLRELRYWLANTVIIMKRGVHKPPEPDDPLCCCEYVDRKGGRSHVAACCCDCEDLDEACDRWGKGTRAQHREPLVLIPFQSLLHFLNVLLTNQSELLTRPIKVDHASCLSQIQCGREKTARFYNQIPRSDPKYGLDWII